MSSMSEDQLILARMYLADAGSSAAQNIQVQNATGGTFTLSFNGYTTTTLPYNAGANVVQNALSVLPSVGLGNVMVNLQPNIPNILLYAVYFGGALAKTALPMITIDGSALTGGATALVTQVSAGGVTAFSDDELQSIYDNAGGNFFLAIAYAYRALQAPSAKFNDYTAGQTNEKKSQLPKQLQELAEYYFHLSVTTDQVQVVHLEEVPPRLRAWPRQVGVPSTSLSTQPPYWPGQWRNRGGWGSGW